MDGSSLKCPKCGSENVSNRITHFDRFCKDCDNIWNLPYDYNIKNRKNGGNKMNALETIELELEKVTAKEKKLRKSNSVTLESINKERVLLKEKQEKVVNKLDKDIKNKFKGIKVTVECYVNKVEVKIGANTVLLYNYNSFKFDNITKKLAFEVKALYENVYGEPIENYYVNYKGIDYGLDSAIYGLANINCRAVFSDNNV